MKLSDGEKLIICMLADLLKATGAKSETNPDFVKEAIISGNTWALAWEYPGIFDAEDKSAYVRDVGDILQMWTTMEETIDRLPPTDLQRFRGVGIITADGRFPGFDGNNESAHRSVAKMMIEHMDRFGRFKGRTLNSHMPTIDRYRSMVQVFKTVVDQRGHQGLTADDIVNILSAP